MTTLTADAAGGLLQRASPGLIPELKTYLERHRQQVEAMIRTGGRESGEIASQRYAKIFDGLLCSLFHATQATLTLEGAWRPVSLAAVGSYGRSTLAFASDLDVRILCEKDL